MVCPGTVKKLPPPLMWSALTLADDVDPRFDRSLRAHRGDSLGDTCSLCDVDCDSSELLESRLAAHRCSLLRRITESRGSAMGAYSGDESRVTSSLYSC